MARLTGAFNDAGFRKAEVSASDVMMRYGMTESSPASSVAFQSGQNIPNPVFETEPGDTYMDNLISRNDRKGTLMETMYKDRNYKAPNTDAKSLMRDPNKAITDGRNIAQKAAGGMEAVKQQQHSFKQDFTQAKAEATQMLAEAAKEQGVDPSEAMDQMVAKGERSNLGMLAGAGLAAGAGSFVTAAVAAGSIKQELSQREKQLSPKEQEAILTDTLKRLQESRKPVDTREDASSSRKVDLGSSENNQNLKQSEVAWEDMKMEDLAELLKADPEGADQPEMEELIIAQHEMEAVQHNHDYVQEHYADSITADKMVASAESNGAMAKILADAEVAPSIDAGDVYLAGEGVKGVGAVASSPEFDSSAVQTFMEWNKLDTEAARQQLDPGISMRV